MHVIVIGVTMKLPCWNGYAPRLSRQLKRAGFGAALLGATIISACSQASAPESAAGPAEDAAPPPLAAAVNPVAASGNAELDELKQQLNDIRAKRSLAPLTFSAERQTQAKAIAGKFAETECSYASLRRILAEEKAPIAVYFASGFSRTDGTYAAQELTPRFVAFEWSDGERQYDADAGACRNGDACASYGAIVRQSASDVGCARHTCGNQSQVWVCSVGP